MKFGLRNFTCSGKLSKRWSSIKSMLRFEITNSLSIWRAHLRDNSKHKIIAGYSQTTNRSSCVSSNYLMSWVAIRPNAFFSGNVHTFRLISVSQIIKYIRLSLYDVFFIFRFKVYMYGWFSNGPGPIYKVIPRLLAPFHITHEISKNIIFGDISGL